MQKIQHTALPWEVVDCRHQRNGQIRIWGRGHIANALASHPQCEANAAYIVRACNVHYELLEALKSTLRIVGDGTLPNWDDIRAVVRKAESE